MPYYKKRTYNKRVGRRRRPRRKPASTSSSLAWALAKRAATSVIKGYVNTERKYFDTSLNGAISSTPTIDTLVGGMVQGTSDVNRIGSQVKFTALTYNYRFDINASASLSFIRVVVGIDYQPNGAHPTVTDVLETGTIPALRQKDTGKRFHILSDKVHTMSINGNRGVYKTNYINLDLKTEFDGNAGSIADVSTNNLFFIVFSNEPTNSPNAVMNWRLRYIDN